MECFQKLPTRNDPRWRVMVVGGIELRSSLTRDILVGPAAGEEAQRRNGGGRLRHAGPDRGVHVVGVGHHHRRIAGRPLSHRRRLRHGRGAQRQRRHLHEQHALRLLHPLQTTPALHNRHE